MHAEGTREISAQSGHRPSPLLLLFCSFSYPSGISRVLQYLCSGEIFIGVLACTLHSSGSDENWGNTFQSAKIQVGSASQLLGWGITKPLCNLILPVSNAHPPWVLDAIPVTGVLFPPLPPPTALYPLSPQRIVVITSSDRQINERQSFCTRICQRVRRKSWRREGGRKILGSTMRMRTTRAAGGV